MEQPFITALPGRGRRNVAMTMPVASMAFIHTGKLRGHIQHRLLPNHTVFKVDMPAHQFALRVGIGRQGTIHQREIRRHRKLNGVDGNLIAFVPRVQIMEHKTQGPFDPADVSNRCPPLQHANLRALGGIKGVGRADLGSSCQVKGQGKDREQHVVLGDHKVVHHRRIRCRKLIRSD